MKTIVILALTACAVLGIACPQSDPDPDTTNHDCPTGTITADVDTDGNPVCISQAQHETDQGCCLCMGQRSAIDGSGLCLIDPPVVDTVDASGNHHTDVSQCVFALDASSSVVVRAQDCLDACSPCASTTAQVTP